MTVREIMDELIRERAKPLAYTTVMTVMGRLAAKAVLTRRRASRGYLYETAAANPAGIAVTQRSHIS